MIEMNDAIKAAIAANLPGAVAGELAAFIKQAEADKVALANVRRDLELSQRDCAATQAKLREQSAIDEQVLKLAASQEALRNEQLVLAYSKAKLVADVADASKSATLEVVGMFLKLPSVRTNVMSTVGVPVQGSPGGNGSYPMAGFVVQSSDAQTTTQTQE